VTDAPHPDLAGLTPEPLEPHERIGAAAARMHAVATLHVRLPMEYRVAFARFSSTMAALAQDHRGGCSCAGRACDVVRIADALLGNEVPL
jgi:hypothetical protein